jgi:hypothetical protein
MKHTGTTTQAGPPLITQDEEVHDMTAKKFASTESKSTSAWLYKRMWFSIPVPGKLTLERDRLSFRADTDETAFSVPLADVRDVTYNWLTMSLKATVGDRRWSISFVGPASHGKARDTEQVLVGVQQLKTWRRLLEDRS